MLSHVICSHARGLLDNYKINFSHLKFVVLSHSLLSAAPSATITVFQHDSVETRCCASLLVLLKKPVPLSSFTRVVKEIVLLVCFRVQETLFCEHQKDQNIVRTQFYGTSKTVFVSFYD